MSTKSSTLITLSTFFRIPNRNNSSNTTLFKLRSTSRLDTTTAKTALMPPVSILRAVAINAAEKALPPRHSTVMLLPMYNSQ